MVQTSMRGRGFRDVSRIALCATVVLPDIEQAEQQLKVLLMIDQQMF